ncbi:MAG: DNRLRE domain-containing protein [Bacteroidales bacterium]|nr:DNRLRE domain-containing protein [Bacteroidales bacterium]
MNTYYTTGNGSTQSFIASAWTYNGTEGIGRSFIQFDLPELPEEFTNFKAFINFYYDYSSQHVGHGGENECKIERITEDWSEFGIDWYNQPSVSIENAVYLPSSATEDQSYPNIDVTQIVMDMYQNPETSFGFRLSLLEENIYRSMILASSDHPDEIIRPSLVIRYDTCMFPEDNFSFETNFLNCQFNYNDPTVTSWKWDFGNGYGAEMQNPLYYYAESGSYMVCLEIENSCGSRIICDSITICDENFPDFTFLVDSLHVDFFNNSIGDLEYYWDFGNGFFSHLENTEFQYESSREYLVCLSAIDQCRTSTICHYINVNTNPFGTEDDTYSKEVIISPNPAYSDFFISTEDLTIDRIEICNISGNIIKSINTDIASDNYHVFLQGYSRGIYLIKIYFENRLLIRKLVLQ